MTRPRGSAAAARSLGSIGTFRNSPYAGVLIGSIPGAQPVDALVDAYARCPEIFSEVVRIIPVEASVVFVRDDVTEALCVALESHALRVAGKRFYARVRLRGLKGRIEGQAVERALGGFLLQRSLEAGRPASVCFDDADIVVVAEVIGRRVGYGFLDREALRMPLIRPR